jgi:hypothetical protein
MSSNIPLARDRLNVIAAYLDGLGYKQTATEIGDIVANLLTRQSPIRRTPIKNPPVSVATKNLIKVYAVAFPLASQVEIGEACGVNPGRVSEVLNGKR